MYRWQNHFLQNVLHWRYKTAILNSLIKINLHVLVQNIENNTHVQNIICVYVDHGRQSGSDKLLQNHKYMMKYRPLALHCAYHKWFPVFFH